MVDGAGNGGNFGSPPNQPDQVRQCDGLRRQQSKTVSCKEIVEAIKAKVKAVALGKAAAGKVDFVGLFPRRVNGDVAGNGIKNRQVLRGMEVHTLEGDFRHDDFPVAGGLVDDLHLVPDFEKLEELFVVALNFPFLSFIDEEHIFINSLVIFQRVPQPVDGFHQKMPPVVDEIPAVYHGFVFINGIFKGVAPANAFREAGQFHILPVFIHNTAQSEQQALIHDFVKRQNDSVFAPPQVKGLLFGEGGIVHLAQPLGLFGAQIAVVDLKHDLTSQS